MTDISIFAFLLLVVLVTAPHVLALVTSRHSNTKIHDRLFISGIVGLLAPTILIFALPVAMLAGLAGASSWLLNTLLLGSATAILLAWIASLGLLVALRRSSTHSHA